MERLEALVAKDLVNDEGARQAVLGLKKKPVFKISKIFEEYEAETKDQVLDLSHDQLRIWRNARKRVVKSFAGVVSDKLITELTVDDAIDFRNFWRDRVVQEGIAAKSANREIGQLSGMIKELNILRRLGLPDLFRGLRLKGEVDKEPTPYENKFIQNRLLADGALDGLNEDARYIIYAFADSGLRPSEIVNLNRKTIHLSAKIPYVSVLPDGRRLKTDDSLREIGQLSGMIKELNILRRLGLPDLFRGLRLKGEVDKEPTPYENKFIQNRLLADGALDGLNEDARYIIYVIADSGLRPSEIVNLNRKTIHLSAKIPYVSVLPDGRRLKTDDS